jgi:hypothetical protein
MPGFFAITARVGGDRAGDRRICVECLALCDGILREELLPGGAENAASG